MSEKYPEHEKLRAHESSALTVSGFLDFLDERRWWIAEHIKDSDHIYPIRESREQIIGLYLDIDPKKLSAEKDAMLAEIRNSHD